MFESAGAAQSFIEATEESSERYDWRIHAYVPIRNHYHLIVKTPKANLVDGMHWLQSTVAMRSIVSEMNAGIFFEDSIKRFCSKSF